LDVARIKTGRVRVQAARNIQQSQFSNFQTTDMRIGEIKKFCQLQDEGQGLMRSAMNQLQLSTRSYHLLKLACTIADLAGKEDIHSTHLAEALQYRPKIVLG